MRPTNYESDPEHRRVAKVCGYIFKRHQTSVITAIAVALRSGGNSMTKIFGHRRRKGKY